MITKRAKMYNQRDAECVTSRTKRETFMYKAIYKDNGITIVFLSVFFLVCLYSLLVCIAREPLKIGTLFWSPICINILWFYDIYIHKIIYIYIIYVYCNIICTLYVRAKSNRGQVPEQPKYCVYMYVVIAIVARFVARVYHRKIIIGRPLPVTSLRGEDILSSEL